MKDNDFFIGIDVGTGNARAGIFDAAGTMMGAATQQIEIWKPETDFVEQSSDNIWKSCCKAVKRAIADSSVKPGQIKGIGFDATCSLVVLNANGRSVTISPTGKDNQNVIVWMDHRAIAQANRINETRHDVLKYVGGVISPEMQSPKLLWLKENLPQTWKRAAEFFDLPDFLTYRATGIDVRSLCTTVCKWTYQGHEQPVVEGSVGRWEDSYWRQIGLGELVDENYSRLGQRVRPMGEAIGSGLTKESAKEMGLLPGTPVGVGIIDAHAGGIGLLGAPLEETSRTVDMWKKRLALIGGTSSCHMAVTSDPVFIPGIWGPYYSAMIPGMWLNEGGQSATGSLIDHVIFSHACAAELKEEAKKSGETVYQILNSHIARISEQVRFPALLTKELHVLPYFHGNRSPRADATLKGMISGLRLSDSIEELALLYLSTIQAIAYGTRHIISEMNSKGYSINTILACGGGTKNPVFLREHADSTGCRIVLPQEPEAVLLGSAILGAVASGRFTSVDEAMGNMNAAGNVIKAADKEVIRYHDAKYKLFLDMYEHQMLYRDVMKEIK